MKLKTYSKENTGNRGGSTTPTINVNKNGSIGLSRKLMELMGAMEGNGLLVHQDEENLNDWYLQVVPDKVGKAFKLREKAGNGMVQNSELARKMLEARSPVKPLKSAKYRVKPEPIEHEGMQLWLIFTSPMKKVEL